MSDQYTRIVCGGSPLSTDAPVVGLLFGTHDGTLKIMDADDIPTEPADATMQISLHQAVFPLHHVVGWYRVSLDNHPTAQDVHLTQSLQQHFQPEGRFLFALLQVQSTNETLPLTLYEVDDATGPVLIATENWQLETSEPERIAVERVVREQPSQQETMDESYSAYGSQATTLHHSLESMHERLVLLITFLEEIEKGVIPTDHALLRHVQGLVCQLGPLMTTPQSEENPMLLSHLAVIAKAVRDVQCYTEKFRSMHENRSVTTREPRRF